MAEVVNFPSKNKSAVTHDVVRRDAAVVEVRRILRGVQVRKGVACAGVMDLGDALIPVRAAAGYGGWGAFLADCGLPKRDAQIAVQLANARPQIEAENAKRASRSQPRLSIRGALEFIRPMKPRSEHSENNPQKKSGTNMLAPAITVDAVLAWLTTATIEEKRRVAVALARDTATIRKLLPAKAIPAKATPQQIFEKAMGLLTSEDAPAVH